MPRKRKPVEGENGLGTRCIHAGSAVPPSPDIIAQIRYWHRQRCFAMEQRKRIDLALGSFLRLMLGWSKDKPESERKAIASRAAALIASEEQHEWTAIIGASQAGRLPFDKIEARAIKEMIALAKTLPAWAAFGEDVRGFGAASLAVIVAEAGGLSNYSNPSKLWKRMGLAVMGDVRQGGLSKGAGAEAWIEHGYNRLRRSRMWNIGDALIKGNKTGEYRAIYLARKEYELARDPQMKPIKAHRRAQRYMEKRLLRNLWQAWRRAEKNMEPTRAAPAALSSAQAERSANSGVISSGVLPDASIRQTENRMTPEEPTSGGRSAKRNMKPSGPLPNASID